LPALLLEFRGPGTVIQALAELFGRTFKVLKAVTQRKVRG
jgi:hypothetical protein